MWDIFICLVVIREIISIPMNLAFQDKTPQETEYMFDILPTHEVLFLVNIGKKLSDLTFFSYEFQYRLHRGR
jgi:hypothetical protein